jgi:hypothetical protein
MADDHGECLQHDEDILRSLTAMLVEQRVEGVIQQQREFNARQVEMNARLEITQACIETLLTRRIPLSANGRDV